MRWTGSVRGLATFFSIVIYGHAIVATAAPPMATATLIATATPMSAAFTSMMFTMRWRRHF